MNDKPQNKSAGKGSKPRPINLKIYGENYDKIFGIKEKKNK